MVQRYQAHVSIDVFQFASKAHTNNGVPVVENSKQLTTKLARSLIPLLAIVGVGVRAGEAPPPPAALEGYFCKYNSGKGRADLDAATSFYMKQAEKAGLTPPESYVWTHVKGPAPVDFVWLSVHESLRAYGANADAEAASAEIAAVNARYDTVATCQAGLATGTTVIAPKGERRNGATLATYACKFREGASAALLPDLTNHVADVNAGMGDAGLDAAFQIMPLTRELDGTDVVLVAAAATTAKWADNLATLNTTPAGQSLIRHFNALLNCSVNLWSSDQVVGGGS